MFDLNVAVTYSDARVNTYELSVDTLCEFEEITGTGFPFSQEGLRPPLKSGLLWPVGTGTIQDGMDARSCAYQRWF